MAVSPVMATRVTHATTAAAASVVPPTTVSPHVARNTLTERRNESGIERSSRTSTGTTKNVARDHAAPSRLATIRPTKAKRSWITRSRTPTVADTIAHIRIGPIRLAAAASAERTVGSPPRIRSVAPATTAAWKKIPIVYVTTYITNSGT